MGKENYLKTELYNLIKKDDKIFDFVQESSLDGLWYWDLENPENEWMSEKFWKILGYNPAEMPHKASAWQDIIFKEDFEIAINNFNKHIENPEHPYDQIVRYRHKNGSVVWIRCRGMAIRDENGKPIRMIGAHNDITNLKKSQEKLLKAKEKADDSNKLKSVFMNNLSHEIRTPMNGIIGFSKMLSKNNITDDKRLYYSRLIQNSSYQLLKIIDDLLEISSLESENIPVKNKAFCINDLLMELYSIFNLKAREKGLPIYIKKGLNYSQSRIISDRFKLHKIISNLIENAIKYTKKGFIEIGYSIKNSNLVIYVKDTGIGISAKNKQDIFERFTRLNNTKNINGGLGLGLAISKENTVLLGGKLDYESNDTGTIFKLSIPYASGLPENKNTEHNKKNNTTIKNTILVVEDLDINYMLIEEFFEEYKSAYKLIHARNGLEAYEYCIRNKEIDLVLMDIKLPIMNGNEALRRIRKKRPGLPIIAQTAFASKKDEQEALNYGYNDFLSKPLSRENVLSKVKEFLNENIKEAYNG